MTDLKVLIPLDGSTQAERALSYVPLLKSVGALQLRLVAATDEEKSGPQPDERAVREAHLLDTYLTSRADRLRGPGVSVETLVEPGPAAEVILEQVGAWRPDLIVITTHGRSGIDRWRLGSVADKVVRGAAVNTLLIGPHACADSPPAIHRILLPLDGSALAEKAVNVGVGLARALDAELHLMRVTTLPVEVGDGYGMTYYPALLDSAVQSAQEYIGNVKENFGAAAAVTTVGVPAAALLEYVEHNKIDLVVMTSHGRGGFLRTALGSVTDRMLGGPAPVLIVRPAQ